MYKMVELSGIKYVFERNLHLCIINIPHVLTENESCCYQSGLQQTIVIRAGTIRLCHSSLRDYVVKLCTNPLFYSHYNINADKKKAEGIYDGEGMNYMAMQYDANEFSYSYHHGRVRPIEAEIALALEFGYARQLMEILFRQYSVVRKEVNGKSFVTFTNNRYPLVPTKIEYDTEECDEWSKWIFPLNTYPWHRKFPKPNIN